MKLSKDALIILLLSLYCSELWDQSNNILKSNNPPIDKDIEEEIKKQFINMFPEELSNEELTALLNQSIRDYINVDS